MQTEGDRSRNLLPLNRARWRLAKLWLSGSGLFCMLLVTQSLTGVYGSDVQRVWGWALPNFLPTTALMVGAFASDALKPYEADAHLVRTDFLTATAWLSAFYLTILMSTILAQPLIRYADPTAQPDRVAALEVSNLWLAPLQGLAVAALGVVFLPQNRSK